MLPAYPVRNMLRAMDTEHYPKEPGETQSRRETGEPFRELILIPPFEGVTPQPAGRAELSVRQEG